VKVVFSFLTFLSFLCFTLSVATYIPPCLSLAQKRPKVKGWKRLPRLWNVHTTLVHDNVPNALCAVVNLSGKQSLSSSSVWCGIPDPEKLAQHHQEAQSQQKILFYINRVFFKENVRYPVWIFTDPISLILGPRFSQILGTWWQFPLILGTRFETLSQNALKNPDINHASLKQKSPFICMQTTVFPNKTFGDFVKMILTRVTITIVFVFTESFWLLLTKELTNHLVNAVIHTLDP